MSKPLTPPNREDKGDVDPGLEESFPQPRKVRFPSYFDDFRNFLRFLALQMGRTPEKRRRHQRREIPNAAAIMAIV